MKRAWPFALFALTALAAAGPALLGFGTLFDATTAGAHLGTPAPPGWNERGDTAFLLPALLRIYNEGLHANEMRLWNPGILCGVPLSADPMVHAYYPPQLLLHRLLPLHAAYHSFLLLHLCFAGVAMGLLLRALGRSDGAVAAGGLLWQLFGYQAHWFTTGILAGTSVFGPLAILALRRARPALAGAALGLAILGSHPQHALYVFLFVLAWAAAVERRRRDVVVAGLLALLVGLPEIMARLETIAHGFRDSSRDTQVLYGSPALLVRAVLGVVLGPALPIRDGLLRSEFASFAGLAGTSLAVAGALRGWNERRIRFLALAAASSLLLAFVPPFVAVLSQPSRWIHVFGFALAMLAAEGVDALAERPGRAWAWGAGAGAGLLLLAAIATRSLPLLAALGFALAVASLRRPLPLALAAVLLELGPGFLALNRTSDPAPLAARTGLLRGIRAGRIAGAPGPVSPTPWNAATGSNLLALQGFESPGGYEAIAPLEAAIWFVEAGGALAGGGRVFALTDFTSPLLDQAALRWLLLPWPELDPGPRWREVGRDGPLRLFENPHALPRERLSPPAGSLAVLERVPGRLRADADLPAPGRLVVAENAFPGWRASVDGVEVELGREGPFQAVTLGAGRHEVRLVYQPSALRIGFPLSMLALIGTLAISARRRV